MLVNLGPIVLFKKSKLTTSSGKHLEDISHAQIVQLMYKLLTPIRRSDELSAGFDRDRGRRKDKLTCNKTKKVNITVELCSRTSWALQNTKKKLHMV